MEREGRTPGRRWLHWLLGLFVLAALAFLALALADRRERLGLLLGRIAGHPWRWSAGWLVAAVGAGTAALLATAAVWVGLVRALGSRVSWSEGILAWAGASLGRYIPGKVWQLSGVALFLKRGGHSGAAAVSAAVVSQVLTLLTGAALGLWLAGRTWLPEMGALRTLGLVAVLFLLVQPSVIRRVTRWGARRLGEDVVVGRMDRRALVRAGGGLAGTWVLHGLGFWCLLRGSLGPGGPGLPEATGIFAAGYVVGYAVLVAPGGLVAREGALTGLLATLGPLAVPVAGAVAVLARLWTMASELLLLGIAGLGARAGVGKGTGGQGRYGEGER